MKLVGIIPARYKSSRFPGKPLCNIVGKPMIYHVYSSVIAWEKWEKVYVATDDDSILKCCRNFNIPCIMTSNNHTDCLDRSSEVASILEEKGYGADRYITIQGDEPLFDVRTLNVDFSPQIVNFYTKIENNIEVDNSNIVKVIISKNQKAIYYSRYPIPYHGEKTKRKNDDPIFYKQLGVYSFSYEMMKIYNSLKPSNLENMEGIGLNRLLENDIDIYMRYSQYDSISVDTVEDRDRVINIIKGKFFQAGGSINDNGFKIDSDGYQMK